jgi:hypothetical protein
MHPITLEKNSRIDIYFGKRERDAAEDVMTLIHQTLPNMKKDETVLVINALCNHDDLVEAVDKIGRKQAAKALVYTASGAKLREKLEFLSTLIAAKNVRMLILNSFEFAACGSRQKHALAHWLREMRDAHRLQVVVYSCAPDAPRNGALFNLGYAASSTVEVGKWRYEEDYQSEYHTTTASEASLQYAANVIASEDAAASSKSSAMTMPRRKWQNKLNLIGAEELVGSLKNKELRAVSAGGEVVEEEYAMAA